MSTSSGSEGSLVAFGTVLSVALESSSATMFSLPGLICVWISYTPATSQTTSKGAVACVPIRPWSAGL